MGFHFGVFNQGGKQANEIGEGGSRPLTDQYDSPTAFQYFPSTERVDEKMVSGGGGSKDEMWWSR